jgi:hypothetical protein
MNPLYKFDMNNSNDEYHNILDLPDEILLIIFKKLNTIDVFYSFGDVNRRFNRLALDFLYIRHLVFSNSSTTRSELIFIHRKIV